MKLTIECTEEQAQLLVNCLEDMARFRMRQGNNFLEHVVWEKYPNKEKYGDRYDKARERWLEMRANAEFTCKALMNILYGEFTTEAPKEADEIADIWRVLRHKIYKAKGGNDEWSTLNNKPIQISDLPLPKVEVKL